MKSYIFDAKTGRKPMTEDEYRKAQMGMNTMPRNVGEGLNEIGQALYYRSRKPEGMKSGGVGKALSGLFGLGAKGGGGLY